MIEIRRRHWVIALLGATALHGALLFMLDRPAQSGAVATGEGGMEISLGPSGGAPGTVEASTDSEVADTVEASETAEAEVPPEAEVPVEPPLDQVEPLAEAQPLPPEPVVETVPTEVPPEPVTVTEAVTSEPVPVEVQVAEAEPPPDPVAVETVTAEEPPPPEPEAVTASEEPPPEPVAARAAPPPPPPKPPQTTPVRQPRPEPQPQPQPQPQPAPTQTAERSQAEPAETPSPQTGASGPAGEEAQPEAGSGQQSSGGGNPGAAADYFALLQAWLERHKDYPQHARSRRQEGTALLYVEMDRDGRVLSYSLRRSAGYSILDGEVEAMIRRASPLPPLPPEMEQQRLSFVVPVEFRIR